MTVKNTKKRILLTHTGTKRGGWNVNWWLETNGSNGFVPVDDATRLGFVRGVSYSTRAALGPFVSRCEAETKAKELGLEAITPQRLARERKRRCGMRKAVSEEKEERGARR